MAMTKEELQRLLDESETTNIELAEGLECSDAAVSQWKTGTRNISNFAEKAIRKFFEDKKEGKTKCSTGRTYQKPRRGRSITQ